jgi:nitrogen fixation protein FixH
MRRFFLLLGVVLALAACGTTGSTGSAAPGQTLTVDGITINLQAQPAQAVLNQQQTWLVTLTDAAGQPIDNADVYIELDMPSMKMGQNNPLASAKGNGTYQAEGLYSMSGEWHVIVHADVNGSDHAALFNINVTE